MTGGTIRFFGGVVLVKKGQFFVFSFLGGAPCFAL